MLGERLYPLIDALQPERACQITGMLLELDDSEVLALLQPADLAAGVQTPTPEKKTEPLRACAMWHKPRPACCSRPAPSRPSPTVSQAHPAGP